MYYLLLFILIQLRSAFTVNANISFLSSITSTTTNTKNLLRMVIIFPNILKTITCNKVTYKILVKNYYGYLYSHLNNFTLDIIHLSFCGIQCFGHQIILDLRNDLVKFGTVLACNNGFVYLEYAHSLEKLNPFYHTDRTIHF